MDDLLGSQQGAVFFHLRKDGFVGLVEGLPRKLAGLDGLPSGSVHRNHHGDLRIILADVKVLHTKSRSGVNAAGTGVQRDMVADDDQRIPIQKRVPCRQMFQLAA